MVQVLILLHMNQYVCMEQQNIVNTVVHTCNSQKVLNIFAFKSDKHTWNFDSIIWCPFFRKEK